MAFAPTTVYPKIGDGTILGNFREKEVGNFFEFSTNNEEIFSEWPHKVWVCEPWEGRDSGFRYAMVKKTVAYIIVDEDDAGNPVVEKWFLKDHNVYDLNR